MAKITQKKESLINHLLWSGYIEDSTGELLERKKVWDGEVYTFDGINHRARLVSYVSTTCLVCGQTHKEETYE